MARRGDPRGAVDVDAEVVVTAQQPLAGVHPDPDPDLLLLRPHMAGQSPLRRGRGEDSAGWRRERREERVALGTDLDAPSKRDRLPHDRVVLVLQATVALVPKLLQQVGRALDVREHEGHGAGG